MNSADVIKLIRKLKGILGALSILKLIGYQWPEAPCVIDGDTFDFVIVGAGTAGCVIAHRLIELGNVSVLLIEAGDNPPLETELAGLFTYLKKSRVDWNFTSSRDTRLMPNYRNNTIEVTQGKMIGGTGCLNYMGYERGNKYDYNRWARITNDSCWSWESVLPTFLKNEKLFDKRVLNTSDRCFYGTDGKIHIMKQYFKRNEDYFAAFKELGWEVPIDINPRTPLGFTNVMFNIHDDKRQSTALKFLSPIKDNPNLYVMTNTLATRIIFDEHRKATGVEVITEGNNVLTVNANIEVIVSAGAIKSPQLLMLSGIGPKDHLESKGIKVIVDLPVGKHFQDHVNSHLMFKLPKAKRGLKLEDPHKYPFPIFDGYNALNKSQDYPDYEVVGISLGAPTDFLGLCSFSFNFNDELCDHLNEKIGSSELFFVLITHLYPKSRGEILLANTDPHDQPIIIPGFYSKQEDVRNHANYLKHFNRILDTSYFKKVGAEMVIPKLKRCEGLEEGSEAFWECYTVSMSDTAYYYVGTCGMGSVLDSRLRVLGAKNLRVIDASSFPDTIGSTTQATVIMVAQKGVEFIIEEHFKK